MNHWIVSHSRRLLTVAYESEIAAGNATTGPERQATPAKRARIGAR